MNNNQFDELKKWFISGEEIFAEQYEGEVDEGSISFGAGFQDGLLAGILIMTGMNARQAAVYLDAARSVWGRDPKTTNMILNHSRQKPEESVEKPAIVLVGKLW